MTCKRQTLVSRVHVFSLHIVCFKHHCDMRQISICLRKLFFFFKLFSISRNYLRKKSSLKKKIKTYDVARCNEAVERCKTCDTNYMY